jgi:hypothetical protein
MHAIVIAIAVAGFFLALHAVATTAIGAENQGSFRVALIELKRAGCTHRVIVLAGCFVAGCFVAGTAVDDHGRAAFT